MFYSAFFAHCTKWEYTVHIIVPSDFHSISKQLPHRATSQRLIAAIARRRKENLQNVISQAKTETTRTEVFQFKDAIWQFEWSQASPRLASEWDAIGGCDGWHIPVPVWNTLKALNFYVQINTHKGREIWRGFYKTPQKTRADAWMSDE